MEKQPIIAIDRLTGKPYGAPPEEAENTSASTLLSNEAIQAIYAEASTARWVPKWKYDKQGNKVGYEKVSIDAWCE